MSGAGGREATNLQRRIERREQRTSAKERGMVLIVAPAGAKIGPDEQQYGDSLAGRGAGMTLINLTKPGELGSSR